LWELPGTRALNWPGCCCGILASRQARRSLPGAWTKRRGARRRSTEPRFTRNWPGGSGNLKLEPFSWELLASRGVEVLFLATPHEQSREWVPEALARGLRVIDLSGAWRLTEAANRAVYAFEDEGSELAAATQAQAVYGLPELHRAQIAGARLIANPGCYATSIILPLKPLVAAGTGRSQARHRRRRQERRERRGQGAHRQNALHVRGRQSLRLWSLHASPHRRVAGADRHRCERDRFHAASAAHSARHSSTIYVRFREPQTADSASRASITIFCRQSHGPALRQALPQIQYSVRTNYADIGFQLAADGRRAVIVSCLDNLLKGASSAGRAKSERDARLARIGRSRMKLAAEGLNEVRRQIGWSGP
jgi:N-acetyl-gamma-glutamyl-phosphate reductase